MGDGIYLSDHGTSLFANNLKYKIAEALGIRIAKKKRDERYYQRRGPYDNRRFSDYNSDNNLTRNNRYETSFNEYNNVK